MQLHHSDDGCQYTSFRFGKRCRASYPLSARYAMHTTIGYVRCGSSQRSSLPRSLSLILGSRRGSCAVLESAEVIHYNLLKFLIKSGSPGWNRTNDQRINRETSPEPVVPGRRKSES